MNATIIGRPAAALGAVVLLVLGTTACATKKHVRQTVAPVEARVTAAEKKNAEQAASIGELENSVSRADEKAMDADKKAVAAGQAADRANQAALEARSRADSAQTLGEQNRTRLGEVAGMVENIDNYQLVTTESILFRLNRHALSKEAMQQLDEAVAKIKNNKNYILEIQGFTDASGGKNTNLALSQKRADEVVRYLTVNHQIPLRKIHVLGVGEESFAADNKTREGRKQNRRVEVKVFALDLAGKAPGAQASTTPRATPQ